MPRFSISTSLNILITTSVAFLLTYAGLRLFAQQGSYLQQGYAGLNANINLSNVAIGVLIILAVSIFASKQLKKQTRTSKNVRKVGITLLLVVGCLWLLWVTLVAYALFSGHLLDSWNF